MKCGKERGCSFVVMSACSAMVRQKENATRLGRGLGITLAGLVILAVVGVNSAGAQTLKTPEAVTASENIDALKSAARPRSCGNGVCNGTETCSTCTTDCGQCPVCGDGVRSVDENCGTCVADCGACPAPVCQSDADCVPATCCHAAACVPIAQSPDCGDGGVGCSAECQPFTMDCGQGYCACQNGQCTAVIFAELLLEREREGPSR